MGRGASGGPTCGPCPLGIHLCSGIPGTQNDHGARYRESDPGEFPECEDHGAGDDGQHFAAEVIDASFKGMNRVQQQRAVYAALKGKMDGAHGERHALALTTKAPE